MLIMSSCSLPFTNSYQLVVSSCTLANKHSSSPCSAVILAAQPMRSCCCSASQTNSSATVKPNCAIAHMLFYCTAVLLQLTVHSSSASTSSCTRIYQ
eukprot:2652-Heterococcus_DN1.PRE.1